MEKSVLEACTSANRPFNDFLLGWSRRSLLVPVLMRSRELAPFWDQLMFGAKSVHHPRITSSNFANVSRPSFYVCSMVRRCNLRCGECSILAFFYLRRAFSSFLFPRGFSLVSRLCFFLGAFAQFVHCCGAQRLLPRKVFAAVEQKSPRNIFAVTRNN